MAACNNNPNLTQIIVLGKSEAPAWDEENYTGFEDGWNAKDYDGTEFYDVIYKP